ncbi:MAG: response regulator transcription factor [Deltaproteobacteria bacterium]|nr:response regulator transcription factor [Deltaproteobacteria bacterium]
MSAGPILIVDDEDDLRTLLDLHLRREGFRTMLAATGTEALELAARTPPSLVVLDLMLPDLSGTEVCRRLRAMPALKGTPVIMLTARGEEIDRVVGFEVGADDYVVKSSFSMREFVLRVRAVLRRGTPSAVPDETPAASLVTFGPLAIDGAGHRVFVAGEEVALTATEFRLLDALVQRPGRVLTRGMLLEEVWDMPPDLNTRTVDTHVKRLREKLGEAAGTLETVRGVGYRFTADRTE